MNRRLTIPTGTFAVTWVCAHGLDVPVTAFLAVWAGLSVSSALIYRFWLSEALS